jgi:hypothetical protein
MELALDSPTVKVGVCVTCSTGLSVPASAWDAAIVRGTVKPKPH